MAEEGLSWIWIVAIIAAVILGLVIIAYLYRWWIQGARYKKINRIDGKVVIITGANTGIGKETAIDLAQRGGKIYMACRSVQRGEDARKEVIERSGSQNVHLLTLDLSSLDSVRKCADDFLARESRLDILINNAGIMACPKKLTSDGYELQIGTNHLGHFLFTLLLLDTIKKSAPSRIVNVSSMAHLYGKIKKDDLMSEKHYTPIEAYNQSKLANVMFTKELARRLKEHDVTVFSLHPGAIATELGRNLSDSYGVVLGTLFRCAQPYLFKTPNAGAQTTLTCALDPDIEHLSGEYFADCKVAKHNKLADDVELCKWLWAESEKYTGLNEAKTAPRY